MILFVWLVLEIYLVVLFTVALVGDSRVSELISMDLFELGLTAQ